MTNAVNCGKAGLRMKDKLMKNLGLKILAILCSVTLWFIVVNISDPNVTHTFRDISVKVINTDVITNQNKVYEILDQSDTIDVTVVAKRSVIESLRNDDIKAVADCSNLTLSNTIEIQLSTDSYNSSLASIKSKTSSLKMNIEDKVQKQLRIEANTTGDLEKGYLLGDVLTDTNLVNISGAQSIIDKVSRVEATVNVTGMTSDISAKSELKFYDADDNLLDSSKITKNISSVQVNVEILATKTVNITATAMGVTADGYQLTGQIDCTPSSVLIAGASKTLSKITSIVIPEEAINVTGKNEDSTTIVSIGSYLPDGIKLGNSKFDGKVTVKAYIGKEVTKQFAITNNMITVQNLPDSMKYEISEFNGATDSTVTVEISALQTTFDAMGSANISGTIDIKNLLNENQSEIKPGNYVVIPDFNLSDGMRMLTTCELTLVISNK